MIVDETPVGLELNQISFSEAVERFMIDEKAESYIQAVVQVMEEFDLEEKAVAKLLSVSLKDKLELEAIENGNLKRTSSPMLTFE
jgi:hypothetical protein